jgi:ferredoxin
MKQISTLLAFCALNIITPCHATDYVWSGGGKDGCWNTPANWQPDKGFPRSGDNVVLPPTTAKVTINLNGDQAVRSVTFNPQAPFCYIIAGNTLTLDDGGGIQFLQLAKDAGMDDAAVQIITSDIKLAGNATFGNDNRWYFGGELLSLRGRKPQRPYWTFACESCMRCMGFCPEGAIEAGHLWAVGLYFILTVPFAWWLLNAGAQAAFWPAPMPGSRTVFGLQYLFSLLALAAAYAGFWQLLRVRWINTLFTLTTFTHRWRRYHEPDTTLKD